MTKNDLLKKEHEILTDMALFESADSHEGSGMATVLAYLAGIHDMAQAAIEMMDVEEDLPCEQC